jgi:O-antigen ligase
LLLAATVVSIAAGTPLELAVSGRTLSLGPTDALVALVCVAAPFWYRRLPPPSTFLVCAVLWVLWVWTSAVFWSLDFRRSVFSAKALLEGAVIYVAAWHVAEEGEGRIFPLAVRLLNAVLVAQIAWAAWRLVTGPAQGFYALKGQILLPLGGSNFLAMFLEFGLLYELLSRRRWWMIFALADAVGTVLTFSGGALLATGATLAAAAVVVLGMRGQRKVSIVMMAVLALTAAALATTPALRVLVAAFSIVGRTAASRLELWQDAWQAAAWRPLTGVGYAAYESIGTMRAAHSLPLALLAETGVIGLGLFALALAAAVARVVRAALDPGTGPRRAEALGIAGGLAVILAHSLIEPFFSGFSLVWAGAVFAWINGPWVPLQRPLASTAAGTAEAAATTS